MKAAILGKNTSGKEALERGHRTLANFQPSTIDPHGPESALVGSALLFRRLGPETYELRSILDELKKPQRDRDKKLLKVLIKAVKNQLRTKGLDDLMDIMKNPRSLADLLAEYDSGARFLPSDVLPELFRIFLDKDSQQRNGQRRRGPKPKNPVTRKVLDWLEAHPDDYDLEEKLDECTDHESVRLLGADLCARVYEGEIVDSPSRLKTVQRLVYQRKRLRDKKEGKKLGIN